MKGVGENIQALLKEFSEITLDIKINESYFHDIDNPQIEIDNETLDVLEFYYPQIWDFNLIFNKDFQDNRHSVEDFNQDINLKYYTYITELKLKAYLEIDEDVISEDSVLIKINNLRSIKSLFKELLSNYFIITEDKCSQYFGLLDNKILKRSISENKMINHLLEKKLTHSFLLTHKITIDNFIDYIDDKLHILNEQRNFDGNFLNDHNTAIISETKISKQTSVKEKGRTYRSKSFELNPKLYNSDPQNSDSYLEEKLKEFHAALYKYDFIDKIDFRFFSHIFTNKEVEEQIKWKTDAKELYYLIKTLHDRGIIITSKNFWQITCKCFIAYHKSNRPVTSESISRCHVPTLGERLRRLDSVIDTLK